mmetsp:Transcript_42953/g.96577  ORF Transcript_42953/g.96577 Transcript_42953/m.96577 type:complete len:309 (-) Transcript_42953:74-1000(-)
MAAMAAYDVSRYGQVTTAGFDATGAYVVTGSTDTVVRIWAEEGFQLLRELRAHRCPVSAVAWARGRFSTMIASGASDGQVVAWRELRPGEWVVAHTLHVTGAVADLAWSPPEYGLCLAIAGTDDLGVLTLLTRRELQGGGEQWHVESFAAHPGGAQAVSWAPSTSPVTLATGPAVSRAVTTAGKRFVTCGHDGSACVWRCENDKWFEQQALSGDKQGTGKVRDVAWRPNIGVPASLIALCTEDGTVATWVQDAEGLQWRLQATWNAGGDARRLAWSRTGTLLAVSVGANERKLYKEVPGGNWECVSDA